VTERTEQESAVSRTARSTDPLALLGGEVAGVLRRAWGRGPSRVVARWAGPDILLLLMEDAHTDAERTLRTAGYEDEVVRERLRLHAIVEDELAACVERAVGRRVRTTLGATRLDPDLSAELFLLAAGGS
jgi:Na+-translocating membrane potential-generating system (MpsC)